MQITSATFPHHIARAYGVRAAPPVARAIQTAPTDGADAIAKISPAKPKAVGDVNRLIASVVPGSISFTEDGVAMPKAPALPIYKHPADRNAAATGIALGSSIDVSG